MTSPNPTAVSADALAGHGTANLTSVGIDVGGTKTHLAAIDVHGERTDLVVESALWRTGSLFQSHENLPRLAALVRRLGLITAETAVVAGMHGCDTPAQSQQAAAALRAQLGCEVRVENDAVLIGHAAGRSECIQLIVGTGAVVVGQDSLGRQIVADGYGWLLGDYGSAPALLREAVREVLARADEDALGDDPLAPALMAAHGASDMAELALAVTDGAALTSWGRHAPLIFAQHDAGSAAAQAVIAGAARRIARGISAVSARGAIGEVVVAAGGVIVNQPSLQRAIALELSVQAPHLRLQVLQGPPVDGALVLARSPRR